VSEQERLERFAPLAFDIWEAATRVERARCVELAREAGDDFIADLIEGAE
jgi:hypothetical protein